MQENLFIIGDIHGCYYTFQQLLKLHWREGEEQLIQVGDLISKGNHSPQVVALARALQASHRAVFLQGNHEYQAINHYLNGVESLYWYEDFLQPMEKQYDKMHRDLKSDIQWLASNPLYWENAHVFVSHAGISMMDDPYNPHNYHGLLWHRSPLKNIGKLQVIGHTPKTYPVYDAERNYCNVDTGAFKGEMLTGVKINSDGTFKEFVSVITDTRDIF